MNKKYELPQYFPSEIEDGESTLNLGNITIFNEDPSQFHNSDHVTIRQLKIKSTETGELLQNVEHIHFKSWPDM
jgi:protein tyrosine phosphatase